MNMNKVVAWLTRHAPEQAQRDYFESRGLTVVQPKSFADAGYSFSNGKDVAKYAQDAAHEAGGTLALTVAVVPMQFVNDAVKALGDVPLIRAEMDRKVDPNDPNKAVFVWRGTFKRVVKVDIIEEPFEL
jgi:hypothetical protein